MARLPVLVFLTALAAPSAAHADLFKLFGEVHGGGMYGQGTEGDQKDSAFFEKSQGPTYGALIGAELLIFDAWIQHHQYINGDGLQTWTQFGLGLHFTFDLGTAQDIKNHHGGYVELSSGLWFGVGTGAQVMPPLDNAQLTDKGFLVDGRFGFGKHLSSVFDLGVVIPVTYGFFTKSGNGADVNNLSDDYRGWAIEGLVALRANIRLL